MSKCTCGRDYVNDDEHAPECAKSKAKPCRPCRFCDGTECDRHDANGNRVNALLDAILTPQEAEKMETKAAEPPTPSAEPSEQTKRLERTHADQYVPGELEELSRRLDALEARRSP